MKPPIFSKQHIPHKLWSTFLLSWLLSIIVLISAFNYFVNPYGIFKEDKNCTINCKKKHLISDRMSKVYRFEGLHARTIIMGTSRSGLFSTKILEHYAPQPIVNFSLPGSSIEEQAAYIHFAITHADIKHILWGLDFFSFNPTKPIHPDFKPERLTSYIYWPDYTVSLFNFFTFKNSLLTLIDNYPFKKCNHNESIEYRQSLDEQTFSPKRLEYNIQHTLDEYAREKSFLNSSVMTKPESLSANIDFVRRTVDLCKQYGVDLHIYTSPVYTNHLDLYKQLKLNNSFNTWKRSLAHITDYTDFALSNTITREKNNFRDSSHIIGKFGYKITKMIYDTNSSISKAGFGFKVTVENIEEHLKKLH